MNGSGKCVKGAALGVLLLGVVALAAGCQFISSLTSPNPPNASVAKWFDGHTAAISITNDDWPTRGREPDIDGYVLEHGLMMGYEMVTGATFFGDQIFSGPEDERIAYLMSDLVPQGFSYFGHGHDHVDHDELSYAEALESFRTNYETMQEWGMTPIAYAYPRSAGHEAETQQALADSGFLSGRLLTRNSADFYNIPGDQLAPDNWFGLMSAEMQSIDFEGCKPCVNDNAELMPVLDEALAQTAWLILTYHAIGQPEWYGWYHYDEFQKDVQAIAARDFWTASMNDITLYVRERADTVLTVDVVAGNAGTESIAITLSDGLDNARFNHPLTVLFDLPTDWVGRPFTVMQDGELLLDEVVFDTEAAKLHLLPNERAYILRLGLRR